MAQNVLLVAFLVTAIYTDWRWQRIPNLITYPTILIGLALSLFAGLGAPGRGGLLDHALAVAAAFAVSYPFYAARGLKAGDVKFLMSVGALRGTSFLLVSSFYGALVGGLIAIIFIVLRKLSRPAPGEEPNTFKRILAMWIPYGVALGLGGLIALGLDLSRSLN